MKQFCLLAVCLFSASHALAGSPSCLHALSYPIKTISQLSGVEPREGNFNVKAYIVRVHLCPVCVKDAVCESCPSDSIIISDDKKTIKEGDELVATDMPVVTSSAKGFKLGSQYIFSIKISSTTEKNGAVRKEASLLACGPTT
jgi:hypothetical protein